MKSIKAKNATPTMPCTAKTRAFSVAGRLSPNQTAQAPNSAKVSDHKSRLPSWLPQTPEILYSIGLSVCEFSVTSRKEKSDTTKA